MRGARARCNSRLPGAPCFRHSSAEDHQHGVRLRIANELPTGGMDPVGNLRCITTREKGAATPNHEPVLMTPSECRNGHTELRLRRSDTTAQAGPRPATSRRRRRSAPVGGHRKTSAEDSDSTPPHRGPGPQARQHRDLGRRLSSSARANSRGHEPDPNERVAPVLVRTGATRVESDRSSMPASVRSRRAGGATRCRAPAPGRSSG